MQKMNKKGLTASLHANYYHLTMLSSPSKTVAEEAWEILDATIEDVIAADEAGGGHVEHGGRELIDEMVAAIRARDLITILSLINDRPVFAYTSALRIWHKQVGEFLTETKYT